MIMTIYREQSGVFIIEPKWKTAKERILNIQRLRTLPKNVHIIEPLKNPNRLPK